MAFGKSKDEKAPPFGKKAPPFGGKGKAPPFGKKPAGGKAPPPFAKKK